MSEPITTTAFLDSGRRVVKLQGELDVATAPTVSEVLSEGFDVLDFSGLEFLDSSGLRVLLQACRGREQRPLLRGLHGQAQRVLDVTGLLELFVLEDAQRSDASSSDR